MRKNNKIQDKQMICMTIVGLFLTVITNFDWMCDSITNPTVSVLRCLVHYCKIVKL